MDLNFQSVTQESGLPGMYFLRQSGQMATGRRERSEVSTGISKGTQE